MRGFVFLLLLLLLFLSIHAYAQVQDFAHINFRKADSVARLYPNHSVNNLKALSDKLTSPLSTDVEKFRSIYTWVCLNIKNDYDLATENQEKRRKLKDPQARDEWNREFTVTVFQELRKNKSTICTGYAYLLRELAKYASITCSIVDGYGRTVESNIGEPGIANHSWNAVQLNNTWYLCDATWSSGAVDSQTKVFVRDFNDCYFLMAPNLFVRNHFPLDTAYMLVQKKPTLSEFLNRPLVYRYLFDFGFTQLLPETFEVEAVKRQPVTFQFSKTETVIKKVELQVTYSGVTTTAYPTFTQTNGMLTFRHAFPVRGKHIVNMKLNGVYVVTYTVIVN